MKKVLGIELGSTRIKSVLTDECGNVLAVGAFEWENDYKDGHWTYSLEKVKEGLRASFCDLVKNYGKPIDKLDAIGVSAMMHGYLAFDADWNLLVPFRTWRDTTTARAADILTEKMQFNMPQRWCATHYYQAVLNGEKHVKKVAHLTTLAGYVHYMLTGENVLGASDASGAFPLDGKGYDGVKLGIYGELLRERGIETPPEILFPRVAFAGETAGILTEEGAKYLDPTGKLKAGAIVCPPEGDAGTGMVATHCVAPLTANVSVGTSAFLMAVLESPLKAYYKEIDVVATPSGRPAAMIHLNNGTTEINGWISLFSEVAELCGAKIGRGELFEKLFCKSMESDGEVGKIVGYNYLAGEPLADTAVGAPLIVRACDGKLNLANFMQMQIYSAISALRMGMNILEKENVKINAVTAHGGFYKTERVGQVATSAVLGAPVTVMKNAGEGGAWGIALLAGYALNNGVSLEEYLDGIFKGAKGVTLAADESEKAKYRAFFANYQKYLAAERLAAGVDNA